MCACVCVTFLLCKINKTISHSLIHSQWAPLPAVRSCPFWHRQPQWPQDTVPKKKYPLNCSINFEFFRLYPLPPPPAPCIASGKMKMKTAKCIAWQFVNRTLLPATNEFAPCPKPSSTTGVTLFIRNGREVALPTECVKLTRSLSSLCATFFTFFHLPKLF